MSVLLNYILSILLAFDFSRFGAQMLKLSPTWCLLLFVLEADVAQLTSPHQDEEGKVDLSVYEQNHRDPQPPSRSEEVAFKPFACCPRFVLAINNVSVTFRFQEETRGSS